MKLTEHLLSLEKCKLQKATQHEFLRQVGTLTVEPQHLKSWLLQDRYYTGGYIKMMGIMISRLPLYQDQREVEDNDPSWSKEKAQRIIKTLSFALSNVHRESEFFTDILGREPYLQCPQSEDQKLWTKQYVEFVQKTAHNSGYDLGEALVVLWAMEEMFFRAWNYAKSIYQDNVKHQDKSIHTESCQELMINWTMEEFGVFVQECASHVNELSTTDPSRLARLEKVYKDILDLEVEFWDMAYN